jgi:hypothetical protein
MTAIVGFLAFLVCVMMGVIGARAFYEVFTGRRTSRKNRPYVESPSFEEHPAAR